MVNTKNLRDLNKKKKRRLVMHQATVIVLDALLIIAMITSLKIWLSSQKPWKNDFIVILITFIIMFIWAALIIRSTILATNFHNKLEDSVRTKQIQYVLEKLNLIWDMREEIASRLTIKNQELNDIYNEKRGKQLLSDEEVYKKEFNDWAIDYLSRLNKVKTEEELRLDAKIAVDRPDEFDDYLEKLYRLALGIAGENVS